LHGQDALGERFTFRVDTFCIFISLDTAFREAQNMAGREVVSLAPLLQRPGLLDLFPKLLDCLKAKVGGFSTRSSPTHADQVKAQPDRLGRRESGMEGCQYRSLEATGVSA
jgi:hypothetical protein